MNNIEEARLSVTVTLVLQFYHDQVMTGKSDADEAFQLSQMHRRNSLLHYRSCGMGLAHIKEALKSASKANPVQTDLGILTGFEDYLAKFHSGEGSIRRTQAYKYIRLYENWDVVEELKLMSVAACYRLDVTIKIITWGLAKREAGYDLTQLDHHLYFEELTQGKKTETKLSYSQLEKLYQEALDEIDQLRQRVAELSYELN